MADASGNIVGTGSKSDVADEEVVRAVPSGLVRYEDEKFEWREVIRGIYHTFKDVGRF